MMARKSRKHRNESTVPTHPLPLRTAAYLRYSEAKLASPPESIENQLKTIKAFLVRRPDLTLASAYTDVDDHSFQREGFQQMIQAIESRKIDCVIVKDLSILGRNPIEIGYYIESYFPRHNIHLISISDQIEATDGIFNLGKQNSKFVSDDYVDQLQDQIVLLHYEVGKVNLQIERQKFLIDSLEPSVQKEIITPEEGKELHLVFKSKQAELVKVRNQLLENIQRIRINM